MFFFDRWIMQRSCLRKILGGKRLRGRLISTEQGTLWMEGFGDPSHPVTLLLMGGGCQGIFWTEEFCIKLARLGRYVIRFDQRDTGLSFYHRLPYTLLDMAADVTELLRALGVASADLWGMSMGGMVAQLVAAYFPPYVRSLTLMSTTQDIYPIVAALQGIKDQIWEHSSPDKQWIRWLDEVETLPWYAMKKRLYKHVDGWRILNGDGSEFPEKYYIELLWKSILRQRSYRALLRHKDALVASSKLLYDLKNHIKAPTLLIHGKKDPLFPPDHAIDLASTISDSRLVFFEKMGHNFCPLFQDRALEEVKKLYHDLD